MSAMKEKIALNYKNMEALHACSFDLEESIPKVFAHCCEQFVNNSFFTYGDREWTYGEIEKYVQKFATFLQQDLKLKAGERFAIMLPNMIQFPVALFGALSAGLVVVTVNPLYTVRELIHQLKDSGATAIIVLENFSRHLKTALPKTDIKKVIIAKIGDCLGFWKGNAMNFLDKIARGLLLSPTIPGAYYYQSIMRVKNKRTFTKVSISADDLAFLQYTGGTEGLPKGAMLTHRNILSNVAQCLSLLRNELSVGDEVVLVALPLYHIFSLLVCGLVFMILGAKGVLIPNPKNISGMIRTLQKSRITIFIGLNTLMKHLLQNPHFNRIDFSKLKLAITGGMATQKMIAEDWEKRTGVIVREGYGLTESSPVIAMNPITANHYTGSVGLPLAGTEISLRDAAGFVSKEVGELWVRGPQVMKGYWNKPEETARVITEDGWLKTGDIARVDEEGFIYIVDRKKDMILVSGFNVYPQEVESVIASCPGISEVGVTGMPDAQTGEQVKAFVVSKDASITAEKIIAYCREQLAPYKVPKSIEFRKTLPRNTVGKTLRRELQKK
jgi:long-chain acyl-CoA synthetase